MGDFGVPFHTAGVASVAGSCAYVRTLGLYRDRVVDSECSWDSGGERALESALPRVWVRLFLKDIPESVRDPDVAGRPADVGVEF